MGAYLESLKLKVLVTWGSFSPPNEAELFDRSFEEDEFIIQNERRSLRSWLLNKNFRMLGESDSDSSMDALMPFEYLSSRASSYYIGGYFIYLMEYLLDPGESKVCGLGVIHLVSYLASAKLLKDINSMSRLQVNILMETIVIITHPYWIKFMPLDGSHEEKLNSNFQLIEKFVTDENVAIKCGNQQQ